MEQYKPVFKKTLNLLDKYHMAVNEDCLPDIQKDVSGAASEFEKEMLTAAADELNRICAAKKEISGTFRIDLASYNPAFIKAFYLLEKYYLTISDDRWYEVVNDMSGDATKFECAMIVAAVCEIERVYMSNIKKQQQEQTEGNQTVSSVALQ